MIGRTNTGGGGVGGLNFQVIGGTTAPNNPKENTIWVNTSTKITGWVFSATQPTGATGMVWIPVGASSLAAFNALKKNNITVYPISAKQYISGAWVERTAKSYQNGAWVDWLYYIFKSGSGDKVGLILTYESNATVTMTNEKITIVMTTQGYGLHCVTTEKAIDCSKYKRLVCELKCTKQHSESAYKGRLTLDTSRKDPGKTNDAVASVTLSADSTRKKYEIDLSGLNDSYYIALRGGASAEVYDWYLE